MKGGGVHVHGLREDGRAVVTTAAGKLVRRPWCYAPRRLNSVAASGKKGEGRVNYFFTAGREGKKKRQEDARTVHSKSSATIRLGPCGARVRAAST